MSSAGSTLTKRPGPPILKANDPSTLANKIVVLASTDVRAGLERCAALPHDDATTKNRLTAEDLDSEPLRV